MPTVTILRRDRGQNDSYEQSFSFDGDLNRTVVDLLHELNDRETLTDVTGETARRICFECSCGTGRCGACAMLVGGRPALACGVKLSEALGKEDSFTLAPLRAFPCVCDLQVDRGVLRDRMREAGLWLTGEPGQGEDTLFSACLHCGLCAEGCEKYHSGKYDAPCVYAAAEFIVTVDDPDGARRKAVKKLLHKPLLCPCRHPVCEEVCPQRLPLRQAVKHVSGSFLPL